MDSTLQSRRSSQGIGIRTGDTHRELLLPGEVLGGTYEIRCKLGQGGMGQVYEAHDLRLDRRVAIKVAFPGMSILREARALATLRGHRSMVTVHGVGSHGGHEYFVMDRIHGVTLRQHLDGRRADSDPLPVSEVVKIGAAMAEGLAVVHEAGMAHRDVKPANVILAPNDRVVITDLGIFKPECDRSSSALVMGTPEYMAPEAACGDVAPGEQFLVDVYALGVVLFEMLTGEVPFQARAAARVLAMHVSEPLPDLAPLRPDAPADLVALVRSMMAKSPRARPPGMQEIGRQLREPPLEPPPLRSSFSTVIAEDNEATAAILASLVTEGVRGGDVRLARDGREALEMVRRRAPNLLVVDLHLPVISGLELCTRLAASEVASRCWIVGISALAEQRELEALQRLGCVRYLPKGEECSIQLPGLARRAASSAPPH